MATVTDAVKLGVGSEARHHEAEPIIAAKRQRFENALTGLKPGRSQKGRLKAVDKMRQKIGRRRERDALVGHHDDFTVAVNAKQPASVLSWCDHQAGEPRDRRLGTTILRTSPTDWDLDTILKTNWRLTAIEANCRALKSELGLRPIDHQKFDRLAGHLFIAVFAGYGVTRKRLRRRDHNIHNRWTMLRYQLAS